MTHLNALPNPCRGSLPGQFIVFHFLDCIVCLVERKINWDFLTKFLTSSLHDLHYTQGHQSVLPGSEEEGEAYPFKTNDDKSDKILK